MTNPVGSNTGICWSAGTPYRLPVERVHAVRPALMPTEMQAEMTVRMHEGDAVSAMQEAVDQLALSMFDSLRLIPFAEEATLRGTFELC